MLVTPLRVNPYFSHKFQIDYLLCIKVIFDHVGPFCTNGMLLFTGCFTVSGTPEHRFEWKHIGPIMFGSTGSESSGSDMLLDFSFTVSWFDPQFHLEITKIGQ